MLQHLAAAQTLHLTNETLYVGRAASVEERIAAGLAIPFVGIRVGGLRSMGATSQVRNLLHMAQAAGVAGQAIERFKPSVILATGGYVSAPVLWAGWRRKVPIVIELPDLEPGSAIQATWRLSKQVACVFFRSIATVPKRTGNSDRVSGAERILSSEHGRPDGHISNWIQRCRS